MQIQKRLSGFCEPITLIAIAVCLGVGAFYMIASSKIDSPAEQIAEMGLKTQGIDIDFSRDKKQNANNTTPVATNS